MNGIQFNLTEDEEKIWCYTWMILRYVANLPLHVIILFHRMKIEMLKVFITLI